MTYEEWERRSTEVNEVQSSATSCESIPSGLRRGAATTKKT